MFPHQHMLSSQLWLRRFSALRYKWSACRTQQIVLDFLYFITILQMDNDMHTFELQSVFYVKSNIEHVYKKLVNIELKLFLFNAKQRRIRRPAATLRLDPTLPRSYGAHCRQFRYYYYFLDAHNIEMRTRVEIQVTNIDYESGTRSDLSADAVMSLTG